MDSGPSARPPLIKPERMEREVLEVGLRPYGNAGYEKYWVSCAPALEPELTPTGRVRKNRKQLEEGFWLSRTGSVLGRLSKDGGLDDFKLGAAARHILDKIAPEHPDREALIAEAKEAPQQASKRARNIGSDCHKAIEFYLRSGQNKQLPGWYPDHASQEVRYGLTLWIDWWESSGLDVAMVQNRHGELVMGLEQVVYSKRLGVAGTYDIMAERRVDGKRGLVSLKTSRDLHGSYIMQEVSYAAALRDMGRELPDWALLSHIPKDCASPVRWAWAWENLEQLAGLLQVWDDFVYVLDRMPTSIRSESHPTGDLVAFPPECDGDDLIDPGVGCDLCGHIPDELNGPPAQAPTVAPAETPAYLPGYAPKVPPLTYNIGEGKTAIIGPASPCAECASTLTMLGNRDEELRTMRAQLRKLQRETNGGKNG